jgi:Tfp pilus assembly protein PilV
MQLKLGFRYRPLLELTSSQQGLTMAEVVISMIVGAVFLTVLLQNIVTSAGFKVRGEQYDKAIIWIQEDLELVKYQATDYQKNINPYSTTCLATNPANGFAASFINDAAVGLGGTSKTFPARQIGGKSLIMTRTATYTGSADPYKLLQIAYSVRSATNGAEVAALTTEVVPHAALKCP